MTVCWIKYNIFNYLSLYHFITFITQQNALGASSLSLDCTTGEICDRTTYGIRECSSKRGRETWTVRRECGRRVKCKTKQKACGQWRGWDEKERQWACQEKKQMSAAWAVIVDSDWMNARDKTNVGPKVWYNVVKREADEREWTNQERDVVY